MSTTNPSSASELDQMPALPTARADLNDALLRVYRRAFSSGFMSGLVNVAGAPPPVAAGAADLVGRSMVDQPIARNAMVESAIAAFLDQEQPVSIADACIPVEVHVPGCGCNEQRGQ